MADDTTQPFAAPGQGSVSVGEMVIKLQGIITKLTSVIDAINTSGSNLNTTLQSLFPQIFGTFTLAAAASTVVTQTAIRANSIPIWIPTNTAAGTLEGSAKKLYLSALTAGASFTVATASGGAAGGTETFSYAVFNPL